MEQIKKGLDRCLEILCVVDFSAMVLLTTFQVVARYVFNRPSSVSETLTRYGFVWLILLGATYVFGQRDHICISFLKDKFCGSMRKKIEILIEVIVIVFALLILVYGGAMITKMNMMQYDSILKIPTGCIYSIIPISGVLIIFYCIYNLCTIIKKERD